VVGHAFFFGHAEFRRGDEQLNGTLHPDDGEDADRYEQAFNAVVAVKATVEARAYVVRHRLGAAAAVAEASVVFHQLYVQTDRAGDLKRYMRQVGLHITVQLGRQSAKAVVFGVGMENAHIFLAAEKYYLFVEDSEAFNLVRLTSNASLGAYAKEIADKHLEIAAVEGDRVDRNVDGYYLNALAAHRAGMVYRVLVTLAKQHAYIL